MYKTQDFHSPPLDTANEASSTLRPDESLNQEKLINNIYKNKSTIGIVNLGNTCFLNSCIQILNYTFELVEILKQNTIKDSHDGVISKEWLELHDMMWSSDVVNKTGISINPSKFVNSIQYVAKNKNRELFTEWSQNDLSEFLLFIMECFHNSISRNIPINIYGTPENVTDKLALKCYSMIKLIYEKEYSEILRDFYGIYVSSITPVKIYNGEQPPKSMDFSGRRVSEDDFFGIQCRKNENIGKPEIFFLLDLPIPLEKSFSPSLHCEGKSKNINIYDCLDLMTSAELLSGENAWFNEITNQKEDAFKELKFWSLPKILIITLKRFSFENNRKNEVYVDYPLKGLDLSKYIIGYESSSYVYDLYGVCNHYGNISGGHYTSIVKVQEDQWLHFNDTQIINASTTDVLSCYAYCLFYRKR